LKALARDPITDPKITVAPNEANLLEMHYVIEGNTGTPYEGGVYHGKLIFPKEYPLKPPSVIMITPSGRFQPGRRLCLSMVSPVFMMILFFGVVVVAVLTLLTRHTITLTLL
jgi:ubiquitin-conjugating enzyme E2 J2